MAPLGELLVGEYDKLTFKLLITKSVKKNESYMDMQKFIMMLPSL